MADVRDPPVALALDRRLVGAARLKIIVADERHVALFRRVLGRSPDAENDAERDDK